MAPFSEDICNKNVRVVPRTATDSLQPYQRLKLCKRGFRDEMVERVCGVSFEDLPLWLWTMRLAEWSTVYITDTDEVRLR